LAAQTICLLLVSRLRSVEGCGTTGSWAAVTLGEGGGREVSREILLHSVLDWFESSSDECYRASGRRGETQGELDKDHWVRD
jgi:hypothetical protein